MDTFKPEHEIELRRQQVRRMQPLARAGSSFAKRVIRKQEARIRELEKQIRAKRQRDRRAPHLGQYQM